MSQSPYNQDQYNQNHYNSEFYAPTDLFAAAADVETRSRFITRTYVHLLGAVLAMVGIEFLLFGVFGMQGAQRLGQMMGGYVWIVVMLLFMGVQWVANSWAMNANSKGMQYAGLGLYAVFASVLIFPLLAFALAVGTGPQIIISAGVATAGLFSLMSLAVFLTKKDFSFMRTALFYAGLALLGLIVFAVVFGAAWYTLIIYFGIALACGYILYDTSNVLHHYHVSQHVAASLALLSSLFMLFWYVLQLYLSRD